MADVLGLVGVAAGLASRAEAAGVPIVLVHPPLVGGLDGYAPLTAGLAEPRVVALDLAPGAEIDRVLDSVCLALEPGDVLLDASGSWWCDTVRRARRMRHRALWHLDIALPDDPGGPCLIAGDAEPVAVAAPLLRRLAPALIHVGTAGSAHFAAMLGAARNAALNRLDDELRQLLEACPLALTDGAASVLGLDAGPRPARQGAWLPDDALQLEAAVPLLAQALMQEQAAALDAHRSAPPPPRVGGFVDPAMLD